MIDFTAAQKRASPDHVVRSRRAMSLIRPFVPRFEDWNQRAAQASATALSKLASPAERNQQIQILTALRAEVENAYEEFEAAVNGERQHSRIDDLRAAFLRLRHVLSRWQRGN
jgi:hypothetical protein